MAPKSTPSAVLRQRILTLLASTESGSLDGTEGKKQLSHLYTWTPYDQEPFLGEGNSPRWQTNANIARNRMVTQGLMQDTFGMWTLTEAGWAEARSLTLDGYSRQEELERREQMWQALMDNGGPANVQRGLLNSLGIFEGQPGFCVPKMTRTPATPDGVAVSFLNTGKHYDDEVSADGAVYHYPKTNRPGRTDEGEVNAAKAAFELGLPVFFITTGSPQNTRVVHRGYIEDMDDAQKVLLVTFTDGELPPPPTKEEIEATFQLTDDETPETYSRRKNRPNQVRFAFDVYKRYGTGCAVCGVNVKGLVQAAHLVPKKNGGSDDARNGLPLCANHHLAFDGGYWSMDPDLKLHAKADGPALDELAIIRADLSHLTRLPHQDALAKVWTDWESNQSGPA